MIFVIDYSLIIFGSLFLGYFICFHTFKKTKFMNFNFKL